MRGPHQNLPAMAAKANTSKRRAPSMPEVRVGSINAEDKRRQMHPRIVDEPGEQNYSGPKPTKGLFRGGKRIA